MARNLSWRILLVLVVILTGLFYLTPSLTSSVPSWWTNVVDKIHLGLDLQGGMHLIIEVQTEKAVENALAQYVENLEEVLDENKIPFIEITLRKDESIAVEFLDDSSDEKFFGTMSDYFSALREIKTETGPELYRPVFRLKEEEIKNIENLSVKQALETIRNRIDQFGVSEPTIQRQGEDRILIQLPGVKDPERAKELLRRTAMLEFKLVNDEDSLEKALEGTPPPDSEILYMQSVNKETGRVLKNPILLKKRTLLTGDLLVDARVRVDSTQFNEPYVSIKFNAKGGKIFKRITTANVNKRLAIVLDNNVHSAPVIRDAIPGGRAQIEGAFTMEEANDLAIVKRFY